MIDLAGLNEQQNDEILKHLRPPKFLCVPHSHPFEWTILNLNNVVSVSVMLKEGLWEVAVVDATGQQHVFDGPMGRKVFEFFSNKNLCQRLENLAWATKQ
jgi:hypothetical protein